MMNKNNNQKQNKGGRTPKTDPSIHHHVFRLTDEENAKLLSLFEASGMPNKAKFIISILFSKVNQRSRNKKYFAGVILKFYNVDLYEKLSLEKRHQFFKDMKNYAIYIETEEPQKEEDYFSILKFNINWSSNMKTFYSPYIVKSISANGIR